MATTPEFFLGINAKIYYHQTPSTALASLTATLDRVQDVSLKITTGDADISSRANSGWKGIAPTLKEAEVSFGLVAGGATAKAGYEALRAEWLANTEFTMAILTGALAADGVEGLVGNWMITEFSRDESLTEAINDFSRQVTVRRTEENLVSMIKDAERTARENITARGGDCSGVMCCMTVNEDLRISVSRPLIVVALTNIIKNAIEAHEARNGFIGASVVVGATVSEGILHIEISDMGGPIDSVGLAKLQEFIPGGSSKASGNGFGLPSARRNIERHGGTLRLADGGGIGLTVKIQIPI